MHLQAAADDAIADARRERLIEWLTGVLGSRDFDIAPASEDASFRRYFRARHDARSLIIMDAPPDREDVSSWLTVAEMLARVGVNAPRVLERNLEEGFLVISDLGTDTYLGQLLTGARPEPLYAAAIAALVAMQAGAAPDVARLPPYDEALLRREMNLFPEWFLGRHLRLALDTREVTMLAEVFERLVHSALAQPRVFVHRDYHSRNLMVSSAGGYGADPGIVDFQDAVYGPVTYDLVSLLRDCYVAWPPDQVRGWIAQFRRQGATAGIDVGADEATFVDWFDLMGVQRHLKAIGIFARLWHRDGKIGYLKDIPRTLNYVREVAGTRPELAELASFIESRVVPALEGVDAARGHASRAQGEQ
jgi:N-acetylmuramate 1-kinase